MIGKGIHHSRSSPHDKSCLIAPTLWNEFIPAPPSLDDRILKPAFGFIGMIDDDRLKSTTLLGPLPYELKKTKDRRSIFIPNLPGEELLLAWRIVRFGWLV
jgi:hypothetical protein